MRIPDGRSRIALFAAGLLLTTIAVSAQGPETVKPQQLMVTVLDALAREDWRGARQPAKWRELVQAFDAELARDPESAMSALVRKAATHIDIDVRPVVVRRVEDLTVSIDSRTRLELETRIPYRAQIYASIDGNEWFLLACGARTLPWTAGLAPGVHRLHAVVDISYLRQSVPEEKEGVCTPPPDANVIQHERRELTPTSFGIFPVLPTSVMASSIEIGLPDVPLSTWLQTELAGVRNGDGPPQWHADFCNPEEAWVFAVGDVRPVPGFARRQTRSICLTYAGSIEDDEAVLALRLRIATVNEDTGEWTFETPSLHDVSIGGDGNILDVPYLSLLPQVLTQPPSSFPVLDVTVAPTDLRYEPAGARPGDPITVTARIRNIGGRDAPTMNGMVALQGEGGRLEWHEFAAEIPANGAFDASFSSTMPASGVIVAQVWPLPSLSWVGGQLPYSQLRDANSENNLAARPIGSARPEWQPFAR